MLDTTEESSTLTVCTALAGEHVLVKTGYTRPAITLDAWQRLFELFFTTNGLGKSTGLGQVFS